MSATVATLTYVVKQTDTSSGIGPLKVGYYVVLFTIASTLRMKDGSSPYVGIFKNPDSLSYLLRDGSSMIEKCLLFCLEKNLVLTRKITLKKKLDLQVIFTSDFQNRPCLAAGK